MRRPQLLSVFAIGLLAALATTHAAQPGKSDTKVKATLTATKPGADGKQTVTITLAIDNKWYIYANPVGDDTFADNRTSVSIKAKGKVKADVKYPAGKLKVEGKFRMNIYQEKAVVTAEVQRADGDTSPLEVAIEVNACLIGENGKTVQCLEQGTIIVKAP